MRDSLFVALSEDLTPTVHDPTPQVHSPALSITPPDSEPPWNPKSRAKKVTGNLLVSEQNGSTSTPSRDGGDGVSLGEGQRRSPSSSPQPPLRPPAMSRPSVRSRASSSGSVASMASTGLGDWMGWFGKSTLAKAQSKQQGKSESAFTEDDIPTTAGSIAEEVAEGSVNDDQSYMRQTDSTSLHERDVTISLTPKQVKEGPTATMRLANGVRNAFRMGSPSSLLHSTSASSPPTAPSHADHKRKTSITVSTRSVTPSIMSSPIAGAFTLPPPLPVPPVAVSTLVSATNATFDLQKDDRVKTTSQASEVSAAVSIIDGEVASLHSSSRSPVDQTSEELARVQGSSLRALCNATRVMTSEPSSILVDHGRDVGELVTRLAWALIINVRDSRLTFKEPVKTKAKVKPPPSLPEHPMDGEVDHNADKRKNRAVTMAKNLSASIAGSTTAVEKARKPSALGSLANPLLIGFGASSSKPKVSSTNTREEVVSGPSTVPSGPSGPSTAGVSSGPTAGALSVALESIIPATAKPPTQYLARTYTSLVSPDFKPPTSFGGFTGDRFATRQDADGREPITDRYGFVYEVSSYDVLLLDRALRASNSAPGCLTGIKVADREEDDDWPLEDDTERAREFEVARGSCDCKDGVKLSDQVATEERKERDVGNAGSEAASMVSTSSSKRSSNRLSQSTKPSRTVALSSPLKIASLDFLPAIEEGAFVPNHACPNTVRSLVARLTDMHDTKQAKLKSEWDAFLRARRDMRPVKAPTAAPARPAALSSGAAAMLGLGPRGAEDDVEELRQSEGLVGFSQMGLVSNQSERKEFGRLVRGGIPLVYRAKVWLECSGALEMAEPGVFRDLLEDAIKEEGIAIAEIEKDVGRTMPLNVFFGGDGVGVDKLRRVLRAYSR